MLAIQLIAVLYSVCIGPLLFAFFMSYGGSFVDTEHGSGTVKARKIQKVGFILGGPVVWLVLLLRKPGLVDFLLKD